MYDFEESRVIGEIKKRKAKRVLVQLPEGLKKEAPRVSRLIQKEANVEVIVSGEPCWGACDLPVDEARTVKADLIVHFGHAPFHKPDVPVVYVELRYQKDILPFMKEHVSVLKPYKRVALVASVQHVHQLPLVKTWLEQEGIRVVIPKGVGRAFHQGQILGCEYTGPKMVEADVDAYVAVTNTFHALGLKLSTEKPLWMFDPANEVVKNLQEEREKITRRRYAMIQEARKAHVFGIIVSTKSGQLNVAVAENLKRKLEEHQKEAMIVMMKEIAPSEITNFSTVDAFVDTACPRVAVEDLPRFSKPILTVTELLVVLGEIPLEEMAKSGFITAPYGAR